MSSPATESPESPKGGSPFRKESLDRAKSPDQLDDYIRVSNPGVWMVLGAVVLLLVAGLVWACCGRLVDTMPTVLVVQDGRATCFVAEDEVNQVAVGDAVSADGASGTVASIGQAPLSPDALAAQLDEYAAYKVNATGWLYPVEVSIDLPDGVYDAHVATSEFAPIDLVLGGAS